MILIFTHHGQLFMHVLSLLPLLPYCITIFFLIFGLENLTFLVHKGLWKDLSAAVLLLFCFPVNHILHLAVDLIGLTIASLIYTVLSGKKQENSVALKLNWHFTI